MTVSVRSHLTAGLAAGLVAAAGIAVVAPTAAPALAPVASPALASPAVALTAALSAFPTFPEIIDVALAATPGEWIINAYSVVQPWVEYGVELFAWATEWLPWPIGLLAPQANIIYSGWQPFAESVVYSLAFLVDGQFDLIVPTLTAGIQTGVTNLIQNEINWILSFFPPLPPIGFAAATVPNRFGVQAAATPETATPEAAVAETVVAEAVVPETAAGTETADAETAAPATTDTGTAVAAGTDAVVATDTAVAADTEANLDTPIAAVPESSVAEPAPRAAVRAPRRVPAAAAAAVAPASEIQAPQPKGGRVTRAATGDVNDAGTSDRPSRAARVAR